MKSNDLRNYDIFPGEKKLTALKRVTFVIKSMVYRAFSFQIFESHSFFTNVEMEVVWFLRRLY